MTIHPSATCCWCAKPLVFVTQAARSSEWVLEGHYWCATMACRDRQREWALAREFKDGKGKKYTEYLFVPLPKQVAFLSASSPYKLYGGAAGPGKSHAMRWALYRLAQKIPNFRALLLRESYEELEQTHFADMEVEQELVGARFVKGDHLMIWAHNKSRIIGGHMQDAKAIRRYLSTNYDVIACDEGSQYPPDPLLELSTRARSTKAAAKPLIGDGQFWVATNPGGPAAIMLKDFFIDKTPDLEKYPALAEGDEEYRPNDWQYIEALLDDNPYSAESYKRKLAVLPKWRYEQLRHANWDINEGQFFDEWNDRWHVRDLEIPRGGLWIEAMDWGYTAPGVVGWFVHLGDNRWHCAMEWKFQKHTPEDVAQRVLEIRADLGIDRPQYTVVDPAMFARTGQGYKGESIAETLARHGVPCRRGDNVRELGWARMHSWLRPMPGRDEPWLTFAPACRYLRRSLPGLKADEHNLEDVDTKMDDHGADMVRMFCMSRPPVGMMRDGGEKPPPPPNSWGFWRKWHARQDQRAGAIA